jgi:small nuclear ribonucleoprotein (snRNP)-like protein
MVATPQQIAALVGKVVKVKIGDTPEVQGDLHSYDPASNMAALNVPTEPGSSLKHYVIARGEHIRSISAVEGGARASTDGDDLMLVSVDAVNKREKKALEKAVDDARHVNTGVSNQVQNVFNALRKTMPCEWNGNDMVVMGLVTIRGPRYVPESCEGADEGSLSRVRKVVRASPARLCAASARARP